MTICYDVIESKSDTEVRVRVESGYGPGTEEKPYLRKRLGCMVARVEDKKRPTVLTVSPDGELMENKRVSMTCSNERLIGVNYIIHQRLSNIKQWLAVAMFEGGWDVDGTYMTDAILHDEDSYDAYAAELAAQKEKDKEETPLLVEDDDHDEVCDDGTFGPLADVYVEEVELEPEPPKKKRGRPKKEKV